MARRVAAEGFLEHDIAGSATFTAFNLMESFTLSHEGSDYNENRGIHGNTTSDRAMGYPTGSATTKLQNNALFASNLLIPSKAGSLPTVIKAIKGGVLTETNGTRTDSNCYLASMEISSEVSGFVMVTYNWVGLDSAWSTTTSGDEAANITSSIFSWYGGDVQFNSTNYSCQRYTVTITNELVAKTSLDLKDVGSKRLPEAFINGGFKVTLSAEFEEMPGYHDFVADDMSENTVTFLATAVNKETSPQTFTLDMTGGNGLHITSLDTSVSGSGADVITYTVEAESETDDLSIITLAIA